MFIYNVKINGGIALKIIIIVLSIFMLIVFGISVYRIFFTSGKLEINDRFIQEDVIDIHPKNYTNILQAVHENPKSYIGKEIKFTGYIYRLIDFEENQFVLARDMLINEQRTQSVVVGFLSEYKNAKDFNDGEWVELIGTIEIGKYHNKEIPIIKVKEMKKSSEPENPFVFPPDDTYIKTSGVL